MRRLSLILLACHGTGAFALKSEKFWDSSSTSWRAEIAHEYEFVGPFPQEAREQHFLNPGNPLESKIMFPLDFINSYPSHLADGGYVNWKNSTVSTATTEPEVSHSRSPNMVHYSIAFPEVRWGSIRAIEGWSGIQHHALLHTKIRLIPPGPHVSTSPTIPVYLVLAASQCSFITVLDPKREISAPQWYACNIYDHPDMPPIRIPLGAYFSPHLNRPASSERVTEIVELDVLMSLDYEIRLFGDPTVSNNDTMPTIKADIAVEVESIGEQILAAGAENDTLGPSALGDNQLGFSINVPSPQSYCARVNPAAHIFPHFVDGWAYGDAVGIEISSCSEEYWAVSLGSILINGRTANEIQLEMVEPIRVAPSQTRLVSMKLTQSSALTTYNASLTIELYLLSDSHPPGITRNIMATVPIQNHPRFSRLAENTQGILLTYYSVSGTPASAVVLPPRNESHRVTHRSRILLALHGAGVMHTHPFWVSALPRPEHAWVLVVHGLTPWGLDWREASRADVCAALRGLVLRLVGVWREDDYCAAHDFISEVALANRTSGLVGVIPVVAIGHSNGGQGALHLASLFPDCISAVIPAAGYTSARLYVPTQVSRGWLFTDTALQGIMGASLQGQNGDIVAGNLVLSRVHLVHGGNDENVPVWHSRERMALIKSWNPGADVEMTEVPGKGHFWDTVFKEDRISSAITDLVSFPYSNLTDTKAAFTLTVIWPLESGSMHGWRIREATIPGRLSRIQVHGNSIRTTNVHSFSIELSKSGLKGGDFVTLDREPVKIPGQPQVWFRLTREKQWEITEAVNVYPSGPLSSILTSTGPITLIIPAEHAGYYETIALRIAHNLYTYLKLDCTILRDSELEGNFPKGRSVVVIGGHHNEYGMAIRSSPVKVHSDGTISVAGKNYHGEGIGALSLHRGHLYMDASDSTGYERILRLFPLRTGVPGPEWMVVGPECDIKGYGGVLAAGFWDRNGELSEPMSYFS